MRTARVSRPGLRRKVSAISALPWLALLLVLVLLVWGIVERIAHVAALRALAADEALPSVQLVTPANGPSTRSVSLPGTIRAWFAAPLYAQVSGYILDWYQDYGASVKQGTLLARISTPGLDEQFETAKANLAVAEARLRLAQVTAKRWSALSGTQAVAQQDVDTRQSAARAQGAQVQAAEHEVARLQALEQFKNVVAPFDGVVTARNTDVGAYVDASGGDASAQASNGDLFTVSDLYKMRVFVAVPQDYAAMLKSGLTATVSLPQFPNRRFEASFQTTSKSFSAANRTVLTELELNNPNLLIWPGTYTDVRFTMPVDPSILILPEQALMFGAQSIQVAVLDAGDRVRLQAVTLGLNFGRSVQVLQGIKAGERIVDNPPAGLLEGEQVRVVPGVAGVAPEPKFRVAIVGQ